MSNPYKSILELTVGGVLICKPVEVALFNSWNEKTQRLEPTLEQFLAACNNDSVGTYTSVKLEYVELLIEEQGLDEDHHAYWHDAKEELDYLVSEAREEFGYSA